MLFTYIDDGTVKQKSKPNGRVVLVFIHFKYFFYPNKLERHLNFY